MRSRDRLGFAVLVLFLLGFPGCGGDWFVPIGPDLVARGVTFLYPPAYIGEQNPVYVVISNHGTVDAPAFSYVVKLLPGEAVLLTVPVPSLGKGATYGREMLVPLSAVPEGTYSLSLEVDPADAVVELDEENNYVESMSPVLARVRVVDIAVDLVVAAEHNVAAGGALQADVTFSNSGIDPVPGFVARVWLSTDTVLSGDDLLVGTENVAGVAAVSTEVANLNMTVPAGAIEGNDYYLIVEADPSDLVDETDEGNNTGYDLVAVHIYLRKRRAVAVGVSKYQDPLIQDLYYCDADATAFADALLAAGEWAPADVQLLKDQFAHKADIEAAVAAAGAELSAGDTFVFFFSGHGYRPEEVPAYMDLPPVDEADGTDEWIMPYDSDYWFVDWDIRDDELEQWFVSYIPAGVEICVILDTCNSAGMGKGKPGGTSLAEGLADDFRRRAKDIDSLSPLVGLFSSAQTELSWENSILQHGVFTYYVLEALSAPSADTDFDGRHSAEEVFDYAAPLTYDYTYLNYDPDVQNPVLVDNCNPGELELRTIP